MKAPMKIGKQHSRFSGLNGMPHSIGWRDIMKNGFCNRIENQSYSHAGAEQHGEPGPVTEFRLGICAANTDFPIATKNQIN